MKKKLFYATLLVASLAFSCPVAVHAEDSKELEIIVEPEVPSDFEVVHNGTGSGKIGITGEQKAEYDLQIRIVSTGLLSQSTFAYSADGGVTWSEEVLVPLSGYYTLGNSGLTINFYLPATENALFLQNDLYECYIPDPLTRIVIQQEGNSDAEVLVISNHPEKRAFDVLEQLGSRIQVKILKSGGFGTAVWQVSKDNGVTWSAQSYAEEKLLITTDTDESLTLQFTTESSSGVFFEKDDMYTIYAERVADNSAGTAIMIIVALGGIFSVVLYFGNKKLKAAIPTELDYEIRK